MNLEQRPGTTQIQKLALTPEIKQSLIILQLPITELQSYLSQQFIENCFLEYETEITTPEVGELSATEPLVPESRDSLIPGELFDNDWEEDYISNISNAAIPTVNIDFPDNSQALSGGANLRDHLLFQLHISPLNPRQFSIGEYLIECINQDGYLMCDLDDAALILNVDCSEVEQALNYIQTFEPPGVGARNLEECLRIQLTHHHKTLFSDASPNPLFDLALYITNNHLIDVAEGHINRILKNANRTTAEVNQAIDIIKRLDPKPGRNFIGYDQPHYIFPDITVKKANPGFLIEVTEISPVKLQVNHYYHQLLNGRFDNPDSKTIDFLKEKYHKALWIMKCLEQRKSTIQRITAAIVEVQQDFLNHGISFLRPLTLQTIAGMVGLDGSTVSRAVHGKYVLTPQGMYTLKHFFSHGVRIGDGATISSKSVQKMIQDMIGAENSQAPLSDQQLADILKEKGVHISRRTVAKYREAMLIPSSNQRRKYQ